MSLTVKNWRVFQHYKDRSPPWIKIQKSLLDDYAFQCLPIASKALAPMLWLLASESDDGSITDDVRELAFRLRWSEKDIASGLKPLIDKGFLVGASGVLAERKQDACLEAEGETETETEGEGRGKARKRASQLPPDFELTSERRAYAEKELANVDAAALLEAFKDYHLAKGTVAKDWNASWRTWVRNSLKWGYPMHPLQPQDKRVKKYDFQGNEING